MLIDAMSASVDGVVNDRHGDFAWGPTDDELFAFHLTRVRGLGAYLLGRRLYEAMLPWETDPSMRSTPLHAAFADVWSALPKVVFSRTLDRVDGNPRLADRSVADELAAVDGDAEIGGPGLAASAIEQGLVDEFRVLRMPIAVGGGTPYLPPVTSPVALDLLETRTFGPAWWTSATAARLRASASPSGRPTRPRPRRRRR